MSTVEASTQIVLSLGQISGIVGGLITSACAVAAVMFRALLSQLNARLKQNAESRKEFETRLEERIREIANEGQAWHELERSFLKLRAELPEKYVRREDYIRGQTVIESKLDAIASELKLVQIQGAKSVER